MKVCRLIAELKCKEKSEVLTTQTVVAIRGTPSEAVACLVQEFPDFRAIDLIAD
jgi:hypothetical protein